MIRGTTGNKEHINIEQYVFEYIWIAGYQIHSVKYQRDPYKQM